MAGEPEFHLDAVLGQLAKNHRRLSGTDRQRRFEQMLQPVTQGSDPAFPAAPVTAPGNGVFHRLRRGGKTFVAGPLQQAMQKRTGARATGESMDVRAAGHHVSRCMRIEAFVVEEFLRLRTFGSFVTALAQSLANAQGTVRSDPPVFTGLAPGDPRSEQCRFVVWRMVMLGARFRHVTVAQCRAVLLQVLQPTLQPGRLSQWRPAPQQITQR
ncbi:hypothetical protein D3C84_758090 [compost metagenome]